MLKHIFHLRIGVLFAIEMAALCSLNIEKPDFFFFRSGVKVAYELDAHSTGIKRLHSALWRELLKVAESHKVATKVHLWDSLKSSPHLSSVVMDLVNGKVGVFGTAED